MDTKIKSPNKTKVYLLRGILASLVSLTIGVAGARQTLQASAEGLSQTETGSPLVGDVRIAPDFGSVSAQDASASSAPGYYDTSVFMTGSVAVGVILPESNGGTENWTQSEINEVKAQIQKGMNLWSGWYAQYGGVGNLTFTYDWHTQVATTYEPIEGSSRNDYLWANQTLAALGYTQTSSNGFNTMIARSRAYVNALRTQMGTDWAFVIFVVDSSADIDGAFTDGYFAYAYLYGPMMVMTYDNDGWGINNMYKVAAHETGHIFGAGDQYYQEGYSGCEGKTQRYGYLGIPNSNCDYPTPTGVASIMKNNSLVLDATSRDQIGWRDTDADGTFDPLDTTPNLLLGNYSPNPTTNSSLSYSGTTYDQPWPHAVCDPNLDRCYFKDVTTQKLSVDYRVDNGAWQSASSADGSFSSAYENFNFGTGALPPGTYNISVRSRTSQGSNEANWTDTVTIHPPPAPATNDAFPGTQITSIPYSNLNVDTSNATTAETDPTSIVYGDCDSNQGLASVWYNYKPAANISLFIDTVGSNYDTVLAVWKMSHGNLTLVTCNDDITSDELQSKVAFPAQAGTTYYIEVIEYAQPAIRMQDTRTLNLNVRNTGVVFEDVPASYWAFSWIQDLFFAGVTGGCSVAPPLYCPTDTVTRAQMAVFLEKGMNGSTYSPPVAPITFNDTGGHWAQYWIEALKSDGITGGCGGGSYCPDFPVTRAQMAIFLLKGKHGASYTPPAATGIMFADVPTSYWAAAWIEQLATEGITSGCGGGNYCPDYPVTRDQMAVFLVRAFALP